MSNNNLIDIMTTNNGQPSRSAKTSTTNAPLSRPSVKHLTCWWWWERKHCKKTEAECLYAHHDTGKYADAPRIFTPGGKAIAGKTLQLYIEDRGIKTDEDGPATAINQPKSPSIKSYTDGHQNPSSKDYEAKIASLEERVKELEAEKAKLKDENKKLIDSGMNLIEDFELIKIDRQALESQIETLKDAVDSTASSRDTHRAIRESLETIFLKVKADNAKLKAEKRVLEDRLQNRSQENTAPTRGTITAAEFAHHGIENATVQGALRNLRL